MSAAGDDNSLVGFLGATHLRHDVADIRCRCDKKNLVVRLNDRIPLRNDRPVFAEDCRDPGIYGGDVLAEIAQFLVNQWATIIGFDTNQLGLTVGEVHHL